MKIGTSLGHFRYLGSAEAVYARVRELGYQTVDESLDQTGASWYANREAMAAYCQKVRQVAAEAGIEISQVHGP